MMIRSTTSSGTKRFDAGHRAERIFVSALFACPASAPRNERSIGDLSMIPKRLDSLGKAVLHPSHSPIPQVLLFEFFFLYALERQITESKNDQQYMPSPAGPASALMVIQTPTPPSTAGSPARSKTVREKGEPSPKSACPHASPLPWSRGPLHHRQSRCDNHRQRHA